MTLLLYWKNVAWC